MTTQKSSKNRGSVPFTDNKPRVQSPLVSSPAVAKREIASLRRGRERLESAPTADNTDARTSLI